MCKILYCHKGHKISSAIRATESLRGTEFLTGITPNRVVGEQFVVLAAKGTNRAQCEKTDIAGGNAYH